MQLLKAGCGRWFFPLIQLHELLVPKGSDGAEIQLLWFLWQYRFKQAALQALCAQQRKELFSSSTKPGTLLVLISGPGWH